MRQIEWDSAADCSAQLQELLKQAGEPGFLVIRFGQPDARPGQGRELFDRWTTSRAVTVADVGCDLAATALDIALCCDLVYSREGTSFDVGAPHKPPSAAVAWALARSGRTGLTRGLLVAGTIPAAEAVRIGLAHQVVPKGQPLPLPDQVSVPALTAARDLMRSSATGESGRALELATFRLLFAAGDPGEGARAFLERRDPDFNKQDL